MFERQTTVVEHQPHYLMLILPRCFLVRFGLNLHFSMSSCMQLQPVEFIGYKVFPSFGLGVFVFKSFKYEKILTVIISIVLFCGTHLCNT